MVEIRICGGRIDVSYTPPTNISTPANIDDLNKTTGNADGILSMLSSLNREELQIVEQLVKRYLNNS